MIDPSSHLFELPRNIPVYFGRSDYVIEYSRGKDVLHLGCVDEGMHELKSQAGTWLHGRLASVTKSLWGVDIDKEGLNWMKEQGLGNLYLEDIEDLTANTEIIKRRFDLILLTEVLEHVDNPGKFLKGTLALFRPGTEMLVTVPNSTSLANLIQNWFAREAVHPDHNYWFSLHTIQSLFNKHGYLLDCVGVYCQYNFNRSLLRYIWSKFTRPFDVRNRKPITSSDISTVVDPNASHRINIVGWLKVVITTLTYRIFISRNPFFADGLILIARPAGQDISGT